MSGSVPRVAQTRQATFPWPAQSERQAMPCPPYRSEIQTKIPEIHIFFRCGKPCSRQMQRATTRWNHAPDTESNRTTLFRRVTIIGSEDASGRSLLMVWRQQIKHRTRVPGCGEDPRHIKRIAVAGTVGMQACLFSIGHRPSRPVRAFPGKAGVTSRTYRACSASAPICQM